MDFSGVVKVFFVITHLHTSPAPVSKYIPQEIVENYVERKLQKYPSETKEILEQDDYFTALAHMAIYDVAEQAVDGDTLNEYTVKRNKALCEQGWQQATTIRRLAAQGRFKEILIEAPPKFTGIVQEMRADRSLRHKDPEFWNNLH
jgi:hypothetical protein